MGKAKEETQKLQGSSMQYQQNIIEEVEKIQNVWMLRQIWLMIQNIQK